MCGALCSRACSLCRPHRLLMPTYAAVTRPLCLPGVGRRSAHVEPVQLNCTAVAGHTLRSGYVLLHQEAEVAVQCLQLRRLVVLPETERAAPRVNCGGRSCGREDAARALFAYGASDGTRCSRSQGGGTRERMGAGSHLGGRPACRGARVKRGACVGQCLHPPPTPHQASTRAPASGVGNRRAPERSAVPGETGGGQRVLRES